MSRFTDKSFLGKDKVKLYKHFGIISRPIISHSEMDHLVDMDLDMDHLVDKFCAFKLTGRSSKILLRPKIKG